MSALVEDSTDVAVLESLDFEIPCARGEHAATLLIHCRRCPASSTLCAAHWQEARRRVEQFLAVAAKPVLVCTGCSVRASTIEELVEVVPL